MLFSSYQQYWKDESKEKRPGTAQFLRIEGPNYTLSIILSLSLRANDVDVISVIFHQGEDNNLIDGPDWCDEKISTWMRMLKRVCVVRM